MKFTKAIAGLGAGVMLFTVATAAPASAAAKTSVEPTGLTGIQQVSHTGRWVIGDGVRLDRATGERAPSWAPTPTGSSTTQFVRDNPNLALERESMVNVVDADGDTVGYRSGPVWLTNSATGSRVRIDTDATGAPLEPSWTPYEIDEPSRNDTPSIVVSPDSVTRDGTLVAFCSNFQVPNQFTLYLKDTRTGALTKRAEECGSGGPDPGGEYVRADPPEISYDGKVVHLRGAVYADGPDDDASYYPDTLVFPLSGKASRTVNGNGSMTRDGESVFMRIGVRPVGTKDRTGGKVGVYSVTTKKVKKLPGRDTIYGTNALWFSASSKATWRGRYVVYGNKAAVIDRKTGRTYDYGKVMRRHGYSPNKITTSNSWSAGPLISGDGKVIFARSGGKYVAVDWR